MGLLRRKIDETPAAAGEHCSACGTRGVVDYVDLVARASSWHCPRCSSLWMSSDAEVPASR